MGFYGFAMIRDLPGLLAYQTLESLSVLKPPDDSAVGQDEAWKAVDAQFPSQSHIIVNGLGLTLGLGQGFRFVGIFEEGKGSFTNDRL